MFGRVFISIIGFVLGRFTDLYLGQSPGEILAWLSEFCVFRLFESSIFVSSCGV